MEENLRPDLGEDNVEEFMNVLEVVRKLCPEERLAYTNPL